MSTNVLRWQSITLCHTGLCFDMSASAPLLPAVNGSTCTLQSVLCLDCVTTTQVVRTFGVRLLNATVGEALGTSAYCTWVDTGTVRVWLGFNATLAVGAFLRPSSTLYAGEGGANTSQGNHIPPSTALAAPRTPAVRLQLNARHVGPCKTLALSINSAGGAGRPLLVRWHLRSTLGVLHLNASSTRTFSIRTSEDAHRVEFPSRALQSLPASGSIAEVTAMNWAGAVATASVPIVTTFQPHVHVVSPAPWNLLRAQDHVWRAELSWGGGLPCDQAPSAVEIVYVWKGCDDASSQLLASLSSSSGNTLYIPAWTLRVHTTYRLAVQVSGWYKNATGSRVFLDIEANFTALALSSTPLLQVTGMLTDQRRCIHGCLCQDLC